MTLKDFGFQKVDPQEKTSRVRGVFESVAPQYDLMNDLMSLGIHRCWKQEMIKKLPLKAQAKVLDVAGGTGDISFLIQQHYPHLFLDIMICDLTPAMLEVGRNRSFNKGLTQGIKWVCGNAEKLPLPDASIDLYTIAFGLRNVTHLEQALEEAWRVLKPGGHFFCLEFSHVRSSPFNQLYDFYSFSLLPWLGEKVAKDRHSYQYLVESIRRFPDQVALENKLRACGMQRVSWQNFMNGISCLHIAQK